MIQKEVHPGLVTEEAALLQRQVGTSTILESNTKQAWLHFIAGGAGGMVGAFLTCPLDVVKTRLQSSLYKPTSPLCPHASKSIINIMGTHIVETFEILKSIKHLEGIRGLFRGLGPNLVGIVPARAINFAAYGNGKRILTEMNDGKDSPMVHLTAAASAGIVTATVTSPIWMVKTRMQLQTMDIASLKQYRNSLDCAYQVVKAEGISGLYRGVSASYLGVVEGTLQWVIYERFKRLIHQRRYARYGDSLNTSNKSLIDWLEYFVAAGSAKLFAAVVTYPHEVVRTRLRQEPDKNGVHKYIGLRQCFSLVIKEEGFLALYNGMTAHLLRTVPNAAIVFFCYEVILHSFGQKKST